jgi:hypothetical protein
MIVRILLVLLLPWIAVDTFCAPGLAFEKTARATVYEGSDYFPMTKGSRWVYERADVHSDGSSEASYETIRVIGSSDGTAKFNELWTEDKAGKVDIGSYIKWYFSEMGMVGLKSVYDKNNKTKSTYSATYPLLPLIVIKGASLTSMGTMRSGDIECPYEVVARVVAFETTTVPAGKFRTAKIKIIDKTCGHGPFHSYYWYAKGVGMVKALITSSDGKTRRVLRNYTVK